MDIGELLSIEQPNEVTYAEGRLPTRTYASKSFTLQFGSDSGHPSRYIYKVFDEAAYEFETGETWEAEVVFETTGGRKQLQLQVSREAGAVRKLRIQKVPTSGDMTKLENILTLNREQATRLIEMLRALEYVPVEGESSVRVDDSLIEEVFSDPNAVRGIYAKDPERFRAMIQSDASADDVIALDRRRKVVETMRSWLANPDVFEEATAESGGPERAWQHLLEQNSWVLGVGLGGQLLTSWDPNKLEQPVVGSSISGPGKVVDALLHTAGAVRSLAFAEIKHHNTDLVDKNAYRSGCWSPSKELSGAVVQSQQTVHLACQEFGKLLPDPKVNGLTPSEGSYVLKPRSYVVAGTLAQLTGEGGAVHTEKFRSFELFRRNLQDPEVITFDELVARAEWYARMSNDN